MDLFYTWLPILLILVAPASLAYPSNIRSQSPILTNDASPRVVSKVNLTHLGQDYPVYPTTCFSPPSRGRLPRPDLTNVLSDCYWIVKEVLLQQNDLLFQDFLFSNNAFKDQSGNQHSSRWHYGQCVISVGCTKKDQRQMVQPFNVVLAANKILKECIEDRRVSQGGTIPIGSLNDSCYVSVLGVRDSDTPNESSISLLSSPDLLRWDIQRSLLRTTSVFESSVGDQNAIDSSASIPLSVNMVKRASNPQHGSSLSMGTQSLKLGGTLSTSNLAQPLTNLSGSVKAPPSYPVECFDPHTTKRTPPFGEDCQFVINHIILRYPNPMSLQTFGYTPSADIDLSLPQNEKWVFKTCVIFVRSVDKTKTDTFRIADVAYTAHRIMTDCVIGVKYPVGGMYIPDPFFFISTALRVARRTFPKPFWVFSLLGLMPWRRHADSGNFKGTSQIGTAVRGFYVAVGGIATTDATNPSISQYSSSVGVEIDRIGTHDTT